MDERLDAPAFRRNRTPILSVLESLLEGVSGNALEIGCGSGQHAVAFAEAFPDIMWWPSDPDPVHRASANAWRADAGCKNLANAIELDATVRPWPFGGDGQPPQTLQLIYAFNVIHISPWAVAEAIAAGTGRHLADDGRFILYGPFKRDGRHTAPSNAAFDQSLRSRDPSWGVRDLGDVAELAERNGLRLVETVEMPSNNMTVVFGRG